MRSRNQPSLVFTQPKFFGGGGGSPSYQAAPPDIPPPTPPVSASSPAVTEVQQNLRRQQLRRKSISSTIKAGATSGWSPNQGGNVAGAGLPAAPSVASGGATKTGVGG